MAQRTDAELIEITTKLRDQYEPNAVAAAEAELQNRNLSVDSVALAEKEVEQKQQINQQKANEPLDTNWRILCLFFPAIINFFLAFLFAGQGYDRKFREAWRWTFYGLGMYMGIIILMIVLGELLL